MASLFKSENYEKLIAEIKKLGTQTNLMCLKEHEDALKKAITDAGFEFSHHYEIDTAIVVQRPSITTGDLLEAIFGLFKVRDGEMFIWQLPKKPLQVSNKYANQCEILVDTADINDTPGVYDVEIITIGWEK